MSLNAFASGYTGDPAPLLAPDARDKAGSTTLAFGANSNKNGSGRIVVDRASSNNNSSGAAAATNKEEEGGGGDNNNWLVVVELRRSSSSADVGTASTVVGGNGHAKADEDVVANIPRSRSDAATLNRVSAVHS